MFAHDFAQAASHPVAENRVPNRSGGDKAGAKCGAVCAKKAQNHKLPAFDPALFLYPIEFRRSGQPAGFGKSETFGSADNAIVTR